MGYPIRDVPRLSLTPDGRSEIGRGDRCDGPTASVTDATDTPSNDEYSGELLDSIENTLWRQYNDKVVHAFVRHHLEAHSGTKVLKTDLFEEALGNNAVELAIPTALVGMDLSQTVVKAAKRRSPTMSLVRADVRRLPFADGALGGVISTSTLDHFHDPKDLALALRELARVARPGAKLILTLDNPLNPLLAVRNAIPHALRLLTRMTPYYVGYTCGPARLGQLLHDAGFQVNETTAILHFPRVLAALAGSALERVRLGVFKEGIVSLLARAEVLKHLPTRWFTGHYIAVLATKQG